MIQTFLYQIFIFKIKSELIFFYNINKKTRSYALVYHILKNHILTI